ncbi:MAG: hypothetical protein B6U85_05390 [Desulfurococcales archaeon ex4484_42]|nr:MAG: hypothetical protein B6U85_05390 [Desulfurococcales archaeon ex4484_42]
MSVAILITLMAISLNLDACPTYQYCLSGSISYAEVINYDGNNIVINLTIVQEPISENKMNVTVKLDLMSYTKGLKINYTPPLLDYVIGYSDGRLKRWSEGKFFIQVILSKELPLSKSYSMITDYGCIQYVVIKIRPLNYVRTISVAEISYLSRLRQGVKAVVTPKTYTVTPITTKAIETKLKELASGIEATTSQEVRSVTTPVGTTIKEYKHFTKSPETSIAIQTKEDLLKIDVKALSIAVVIASLLAILVYIYIFRVRI